jgi:hypothetical protein
VCVCVCPTYLSIHPSILHFKLTCFPYKTLFLRVILRHIHVIPDILWHRRGLNLMHGYAGLAAEFPPKRTFSPGKNIYTHIHSLCVLHTPTDLITCVCYLAFTPSHFSHICAIRDSTLYQSSTIQLQQNTFHRSNAEYSQYSSGKFHGQQQMFYSRLLSGKRKFIQWQWG